MQDPAPVRLSSMIISSVDTLREQETDHTFPPYSGWNDQPPLLIGPRGQPETPALLKGLVRQGIPPALRCAVWLSNIIQAVHPQNGEADNSDYWHQYRSLAKVRALDHAYASIFTKMYQRDLQQLDESFLEGLATPTFGRDIHASLAARVALNNDNDFDNNTMSPAALQQQAFLLIPDATTNGVLAHKRVLLALEQILGLDFAPMIPTLTSILLTAMSESYTFCAIREMTHEIATGVGYFPCTRREQKAWALTFVDILWKLHPQTAESMEDRGVFDHNAKQIAMYMFEEFFLQILPLPFVVRIVDVYTLEGSKVLYRFGVALFVLFKMYAAEQLITISNAQEFWMYFKQWTFSTRFFNWPVVVRKAYGLHGGGGAGAARGIRSRQLRFPRRQIMARIIRMEEERLQAEEDENGGGDDDEYQQAMARPLGLVTPEGQDPTTTTNGSGGGGENGKEQDGANNYYKFNDRTLTGEKEKEFPVLTKSLTTRQHLAQWVPITLRLTNLRLLYSTNYHGRSLEMFYRHVQNTRHTLLICEVLQPPSSSSQSQQEQEQALVGMYASQPWKPSNQVFGDGGCMLFRLQPDPKCWKWSPRKPNNQALQPSDRAASIRDIVDFEEDASSLTSKSQTTTSSSNNNNQTALLEQFMVATRTYISMGGNPDGSCGLRINEDLTRGESSAAMGFHNEPLHHATSTDNDNSSSDLGSVFEIGILEVYEFVRQIDGKKI